MVISNRISSNLKTVGTKSIANLKVILNIFLNEFSKNVTGSINKYTCLWKFQWENI